MSKFRLALSLFLLFVSAQTAAAVSVPELDSLDGLNYFSDDDEQSKLTYADLKEHIGVDCSDYCYDEAYQRGIYTWYADEDDACSLSLFFGDNDKLIAAGAYNLS